MTLGLIGVVFICGLTYYNDYAMANTFLVGNFLPVGLLLFFLAVVMLLNAPLCRWWPGRSLRRGELAVALGMVLVACTIPSSGLMRYLPSSLVGMHYQAGAGGENQRLLQTLDLPDWLFPKFEHKDPAQRAGEPVVQHFWFRAPVERDTFFQHWRAVPWSAWLTPALTWGLLLLLLYGAVICLCVIVRRQWVDNERLPFPLATVYLSLVETPPPGRMLNSLFRARAFWIGAGAVFAVHSLNYLCSYFPKVVPYIPLGYNLQPIFADGPLRFTDIFFFQQQRVYFSAIGIAFFLQGQVGFSLFAFFLISQAIRIWYGQYQCEFTWGMQADQSFGALIMFALAILWIGRRQWWLVLRQMIRGPRHGEPQGRYLPYRAAGWGFLLCVAGVVMWLISAGASVLGAIVIVLLMMVTFLVVARVVAETGLMFVQFPGTLARPWTYAIPAMTLPTRMAEAKSLFFTHWFQTLFTHDLRESLSVYGTHAMRVADEAAYPGERNWRRAMPFVAVLGLALVVGYIVAGVSTLYVEYTYSDTLSAHPYGPINIYGVETTPKAILASTVGSLPPKPSPVESHSNAAHVSIGAGVTALLAFLRLRFAGWPLHPVGYLLAYSYPLGLIWFSVMLGWIAKTLLVKFGGASAFRAARPLFIGLIVGEAATAAAWLMVGLILNQLGLPYHAVRLMPT